MTASRRHTLSFRLRTLFVVTTACAIWLGWQLSVVREREALSRRAQQQGAFVHLKRPGDPFDASVPVGRELLGDVAVNSIVYEHGSIPESEVDRLREKFPEAIVLALTPAQTGTFHPGVIINPPNFDQ